MSIALFCLIAWLSHVKWVCAEKIPLPVGKGLFIGYD